MQQAPCVSIHFSSPTCRFYEEKRTYIIESATNLNNFRWLGMAELYRLTVLWNKYLKYIIYYMERNLLQMYYFGVPERKHSSWNGYAHSGNQKICLAVIHSISILRKLTGYIYSLDRSYYSPPKYIFYKRFQ